ncbi:MAG: 2,3-bisphosphoglycerate-independent phosphoglycerate mutase [Eubacteriales bacterium]|jgi:2,3-bisphosphoglycerate-independent phosphoglycerate mutase
MKKPVMLMILDGFGKNPDVKGNAIAAANTPHLDELFATCPNTYLNASGMAVGLPDGQMGNSEVGHTNIGAGRVVYQELTRITKAAQDGSLEQNEALVGAMENCKTKGTALHLFGLLSDGGVHSHNSHLYALLEMAKKFGLTRVYVHCLLDGRDVPPSSGKEYVEQLQKQLAKIGVGEIASVMGRYYAMDRDNRWERVVKAYDAMVNGKGPFCQDAAQAVAKSYEEGVTDEFVVPTVCSKEGHIEPNDSVICFNFRPDRAREITRTMVDEQFDAFPREKGFFPLYYVCMTQYDATMPNVHVAFKPQSLTNTFGEYVSKQGMTQLRIAETEKYAHVTFFFNGGVEAQYEGEDRCLINSPKVATYDLQPEMSAYEVKDAVIERIRSGKYDVIILNFANCDMVGHTGVFEAAVKAVEAVDTCVGEIVTELKKVQGVLLLTADHGNSDKMIDDDGVTPFTAHTTNPVPLIVMGAGDVKLKPGKLADLAPTMLDLMGLAKPEEMDGESLIVK